MGIDICQPHHRPTRWAKLSAYFCRHTGLSVALATMKISSFCIPAELQISIIFPFSTFITLNVGSMEAGERWKHVKTKSDVVTIRPESITWSPLNQTELSRWYLWDPGPINADTTGGESCHVTVERYFRGAVRAIWIWCEVSVTCVFCYITNINAVISSWQRSFFHECWRFN